MEKDKHIPVVGIVGGIGSGKSTVAAEFERLGCCRIDGDRLGHALLTDDDVKREIREQFGSSVFDDDGKVNRQAVADMVFHDTEKLDILERILHPRIRKEIICAITAAQVKNCPAVVVDAAVLFEAGWNDLCSHVVFVDAPEENCVRRVREKRGWDAETMHARQARQIPLDKKAKRCHHSIRNHASVSHLKEQVRRLFHHITHE